MASYFDEIARNRLKSIILMCIFGALFFFIVFLFVAALGGGIVAILCGLLVVAVLAFLYYLYAEKFVLAVAKAQPADRKQYPMFYEIEEGISAASQIPMPKLYVMNDPNPNAFASGKNSKNASITATTGLLSMMNKEELEGVLAHESSHIADNDIQYMMVAVVFCGAIGIIAAVLRNMIFFGGFRGRGSAGLVILLVAVVVGILAPIFALLIRLAVSRRREYIADANGARITRNPGALASALTKIQKYTGTPQATNVKNATEITASLYFSSPYKTGSLSNLFSTHPPIQERINRLQHMY